MTAASAAVDELDAELARLADTGHYISGEWWETGESNPEPAD